VNIARMYRTHLHEHPSLRFNGAENTASDVQPQVMLTIFVLTQIGAWVEDVILYLNTYLAVLSMNTFGRRICSSLCVRCAPR
jgi:hypothetical protein